MGEPAAGGSGSGQPSRAAIIRRLGILSRTPGRILAAQTEGGLRDLLGDVLRSLFRSMLRFELYVSDGEGGFIPVVKLGDGQFESGLKLLGLLRSRLTMKGDDASFAEAHVLPGLHGVRRGSIIS